MSRVNERPSRARSAFTLIEMLAVSCLVALASGVLIASLHRPARTATGADLVSSISQVDRAARLASMQGDRVEVIASDRRLIARGLVDHALVSAATLPDAIVLAQPGMRAPASITFDSRGRTRDYTVRAAGSRAGETYAVSGLSGWVSRVDVGGTPWPVGVSR